MTEKKLAKKKLTHATSIGISPDEEEPLPEVQEARQSLLNAMVMHKMAPLFSSGPVDFGSEASGRSSAASSLFSSAFPTSNVEKGSQRDSVRSSIRSYSCRASLTESERAYLEKVLQSADPKTIRQASDRLSDETIFPLVDEEKKEAPPVIVRRDSQLQQELFRFHERGSMRPSTLLRRLSSRTASTSFTPSDHKPEENDDSTEKDLAEVIAWLDGNQGVEVDDNGSPLAAHAPSFQILGTAADDASAHPHVLSPPLMEGIQAFMPESLTESHFWLKYSLVRDGPGLMKMLRSVRGSVHTVLAIETTEGYVFGSFTSCPWRLSGGRYFGSRGSFLWRLRKSRLTKSLSPIEQAAMEGELEVFPYVQSNNAVQCCNREGITLGRGELEGSGVSGGDHYGSGLFVNKDLSRGSTSTSETFANPCLTNLGKQGEEFSIANVEVWAMTPYDTVSKAEEEELSLLFFEETQDPDKSKLDLLGILVGSPYGHVNT